MSPRDYENPIRNQQKRTALLVVLVVILVFAVILMLKVLEAKEDAIIIGDAQNKVVQAEESGLIRYGGKWYKQNPDLTTLLLIGTDSLVSGEDGKANQADFLLLVAMDYDHNNYKALQINRDTIADVPQFDMYGRVFGSKKQQIALAYSHTDSDVRNCNNTVKAVSNLLYGIDIDHFVSVAMDSVAIANDMVSGVPVYVEDDFSNIDPSIKQGETVTLSGEQALHFVRARSGMEEPTNIARMQRQRTYMTSLHERAIQKANQDKDFLMRSLLELSSHFISDCSINQMTRMFDVALAQNHSDILTIPGEAVMGQEYMEYHVDEAALQKQIIELLYVEEEGME